MKINEHEQCIQAAKDFSKAFENYNKRLENERKWRVLVEQTLSKNQKFKNSVRV